MKERINKDGLVLGMGILFLFVFGLSRISVAERRGKSRGLQDYAPTKVILTDRTSGWSTILQRPGKGESAEGKIAWDHRSSGKREWILETELINKSEKRRCLAIEYHFTVPGTDYTTLFTAPDPEPEWPENGELAYAYVRESWDWTELVIPFASLGSKRRGEGVSFAPDLADMPIRSFEVRMKKEGDSTGVIIRRPELRLEPRGRVGAKLFVASHGGDTGEGLAWMREKWSGLFLVRKQLENFHWPI